MDSCAAINSSINYICVNNENCALKEKFVIAEENFEVISMHSKHRQ